MLRSEAISRKQERTITKSLNTSIQREEAKTPEIETVYVRESVEKIRKFRVDIDDDENDELTEIPLLSKRALKVKESLNKKEEITAVLLKTDGKSEEIKCNMSSKEINKILNGKPTIIGELEEINVIIVRSLKQTKYSNNEVNQNVLPPPFCNQKYYGNYLLFRIDSNGNPKALLLKEYQSFVGAKKALIEEEMKKNYNSVENTQIKARSDSKLRLVYLQSEFDQTKSLADFDDCKSVSNFMNELVNKMPNNRMIDPDYDPNQDVSIDPDYAPTNAEKKDAEIERENLNNLKLKSKSKSKQSKDWRLELKDALKCVREKGKFDGAVLAERVCETFYESNGVEPTLNELIDIFSKMKSKLFEKNDSKSAEREESSLQMFKTAIVKSKTGVSDSYNVYFEKSVSHKQKEKNFQKAMKSFEMRNNRKPTYLEILRLKQFLFTNNETKEVKFRLIVVEEKEEKYDLFPESKKAKTVKAKVLVSPIKKKKNGSSKFNVYFDIGSNDEKAKEKANENEKAIAWFERFNHRKPTNVELESIERFMRSDREQLIECEYNIPLAAIGEKAQRIAIHYVTDSVIEKKSSTKYILNFNHKKEEQNGDNAQAIKWFERFNNREPSETEKQNIKEFVQNEQDTIDID